MGNTQLGCALALAKALLVTQRAGMRQLQLQRPNARTRRTCAQHRTLKVAIGKSLIDARTQLERRWGVVRAQHTLRRHCLRRLLDVALAALFKAPSSSFVQLFRRPRARHVERGVWWCCGKKKRRANAKKNNEQRCCAEGALAIAADTTLSSIIELLRNVRARQWGWRGEQGSRFHVFRQVTAAGQGLDCSSQLSSCERATSKREKHTTCA